jgi:hypothetical protein
MMPSLRCSCRLIWALRETAMTTRLVDSAPVESNLDAARVEFGLSPESGAASNSSSFGSERITLFDEEDKKPIPRVAFIVGLSAASLRVAQSVVLC